MRVPLPHAKAFASGNILYVYSPQAKYLYVFNKKVREDSRQVKRYGEIAKFYEAGIDADSFFVSDCPIIVTTEETYVEYRCLDSNTKTVSVVFGIPLWLDDRQLIVINDMGLIRQTADEVVEYDCQSVQQIVSTDKFVAVVCKDKLYIINDKGIFGTEANIDRMGIYKDEYLWVTTSNRTLFIKPSKLPKNPLVKLKRFLKFNIIQAMTPDGKYLYSNGKVYDVESGKVIQSGRPIPYKFIGSDGKYCAVYQDSDIVHMLPSYSTVRMEGKLIYTDGKVASYDMHEVATDIICTP